MQHRSGCSASGSKPEPFDHAEHPSNIVLIGLALKICISDAIDAIGQASDHVTMGMLNTTGKLG